VKARFITSAKLRALAASGAIGDLTTLITSQIVVKLIALLGTVVAIRALGPERLGLAAQFTLIAGALYQLLGLGIEIVGPQMVSAAPEEERASIATSLLFLRLRACAASVIILPFVAAWNAWRANVPLDSSQVLVALSGALWMLATIAGSPQFIAQGYGKVRALVLPQVVSSLLLLAGHWLLTLRFLRADVFLLVQSTAGLAYTCLALRQLHIHPLRLDASVWARSRTNIRGAEARGAWLLSIATYAVNDGGVLLMGFLCTHRQLGDLNAALSLIAAAWGLLMWVSYVVYTRQLLWVRNGISTFCQHQKRALRLGWIFALVGGGFALAVGQFPSRLVLGHKFETAPELFAILCACLFFTLPYTMMSGAMSAMGRNRPQAKVIFIWACLAVPCYFPAVLFFGTVGGAWARVVVLAGVTFFQYRAYARFMRQIESESASIEPIAEPLVSLPEAAPCSSADLL
jgi:O-antigen/teichoic acid export membrane protein